VRQLEALVRLSEALARLRCTEKITPAYVREVCSTPAITSFISAPLVATLSIAAVPFSACSGLHLSARYQAHGLRPG